MARGLPLYYADMKSTTVTWHNAKYGRVNHCTISPMWFKLHYRVNVTLFLEDFSKKTI